MVKVYEYVWGNNEKRKTMKGRLCKIVKHLKMNSKLIEFFDNGQREVVSLNAIRKVKDIWDCAKRLSKQIRDRGVELPEDLAENHDKYFH